MSAAHALVSLDPPASLNLRPHIRSNPGLAGMTDDLPHTNGINDGQDQPSAVLVDAEVDGARYLLVRVPKPERQGSPEHVHQPAIDAQIGRWPARRANAAFDSAIFDAFLLQKAIATRGFACFIYSVNGDSAW